VGKKRFTSKTYLKVLIGVGVLALIGGGAGTFATFNAQTTNSGNTFATGTLVLSNTVGATTCLSTGAGTNTDTNTNSAGCAAIFNTSLSKPGDIAGGNLTLTNSGSLAASLLNLTATSCVDSDNGSETYHGSGSVCGALNFYVQEWSNSGFSTPYKCWYGGGTPTTCDPTFATSPESLSGFGTNPVDISAGPNATAFAPNGSTGDTRWFTIAVELPQSANNTFQGRQAALSLTWEEDQ
jgi:predicted ribosomally synthesized peptide with SipW-like signal peptide